MSAARPVTGPRIPTARRRSPGGTALTVTGVIHTLFGLGAYWSVLADIARGGVFSAVGPAVTVTRPCGFLWPAS